MVGSPCQTGRQGVLFIQIQRHIGDHPQYRDLGFLLQHFQSWLEKCHIPPKLIDDAAHHSVLLIWLQQRQGSIELGKHPAPINVPHQQDRCVHQPGQPHVDNVIRFQIDLRRTPRPLNDKNVILLAQAVVGRQNLRNQFSFLAEIFRRLVVPPDLPFDNQLTAHVAGRF